MLIFLLYKNAWKVQLCKDETFFKLAQDVWKYIKCIEEKKP